MSNVTRNSCLEISKMWGVPAGCIIVPFIKYFESHNTPVGFGMLKTTSGLLSFGLEGFSQRWTRSKMLVYKELKSELWIWFCSNSENSFTSLLCFIHKEKEFRLVLSLFFFWLCRPACGIFVTQPGMERTPRFPRLGKSRVLTTGPPGKFLVLLNL